MDGTFGDLGLLLPSWRLARREAHSAPPRTTPASLARAACCASSPYSGGHVKHKIWRHLPRMPSAERREDHSLPWHTSAPKLRQTGSSTFEAAEKWLSLLRRLHADWGAQDITTISCARHRIWAQDVAVHILCAHRVAQDMTATSCEIWS